MPRGKHEEVTAMEERNVHTFRNGAETRTLEFGRLETGETYVRETGRGDITQFCYDAPAHETTISFRETEDYSLEDVADTLRRHTDDVYIGDIAEALTFWGVSYETDEKVLAS
jgi:hypothetical protein